MKPIPWYFSPFSLIRCNTINTTFLLTSHFPKQVFFWHTRSKSNPPPPPPPAHTPVLSVARPQTQFQTLNKQLTLDNNSLTLTLSTTLALTLTHNRSQYTTSQIINIWIVEGIKLLTDWSSIEHIFPFTFIYLHILSPYIHIFCLSIALFCSASLTVVHSFPITIHLLFSHHSFMLSWSWTSDRDTDRTQEAVIQEVWAGNRFQLAQRFTMRFLSTLAKGLFSLVSLSKDNSTVTVSPRAACSRESRHLMEITWLSLCGRSQVGLAAVTQYDVDVHIGYVRPVCQPVCVAVCHSVRLSVCLSVCSLK